MSGVKIINIKGMSNFIMYYCRIRNSSHLEQVTDEGFRLFSTDFFLWRFVIHSAKIFLADSILR